MRGTDWLRGEFIPNVSWTLFQTAYTLSALVFLFIPASRGKLLLIPSFILSFSNMIHYPYNERKRNKIKFYNIVLHDFAERISS